MFADFELHRLGVADLPVAAHDRGDGTERFRTPSLRNVTRTAPYMHNGSLATVADVLVFYDQKPDTSLDPKLPERFPQREVEDFLAFFGSIRDGDFDRMIPARVPSGLPPGGGARADLRR